jgi:diacylglycerol kinase family enzyme
MALLPIGRGNDFGFCMGVPHDLKKSVAILAAGKTRKIDVGFMTGGLFPNGRYFINGIGIGIDAAINFVATRSKISGFPGYLLATFRTLVDYKPAEMEIQLDSMTIVQPTMLVSAMNGRRLGGGFLVAPAAVMDDGFFDVLIGDGMSKLRTLTVLPRFFNGSQEKDSKVHIYRSRTLKVRAISGILPAHADGETVSNDGDRITAELFPAMLEVITDGNPEAN